MNMRLRLLLVLGLVLAIVSAASAVTPEFAALHGERVIPDRQVVLKKVLYASGLMNAGYLGLNDLVAALQLVKNLDDPRAISAQLLAVKIGLEAKPAFLRHIAREIRFCEQYPNFPRGFNDSPEGPEPISQEFEIMADHLENLDIRFESTDLRFLRQEAARVVFAIFWTDSEKIRTLCDSVLHFVRVELKEDLPFDMVTKPARPRPTDSPLPIR